MQQRDAEPYFGLSKSRISAYEQCPKRLWLITHKPELAEYDDYAEAQFATGHEIGEVACSLCPDGLMIDARPDLKSALNSTSELVGQGHPGPIFEATFEHDGVLVRVDILQRASDASWDMAEVKSSTGVKDYHHGDLATQIWVLERAGINLKSAAIRHVNKEFVLSSAGDYSGLFADQDLLSALRVRVDGRGELIKEIRTVLAGAEPTTEAGDQCSSPFICEFWEHCHPTVGAEPECPVTLLPYGAGKRWQKEGVTSVLELDEAALGVRDARIVAATRSGTPFHDVAKARQTLDQWAFPRAWLDFETIGFAVPRWVGTGPYQQVPFQFSLHLEQSDGAISHHEFLSNDGDDPRRACAEALVALIPEGATPVAYNASFERRVLRELASAVPELSARLHAIADATVDLLPVARECWYHRDQRGSWSIKAVLPTIADLRYDRLAVQDGAQAQTAYLEAIDGNTTPSRRHELEVGLKNYCRLDTLAMIVIGRHFVGAEPPEIF